MTIDEKIKRLNRLVIWKLDKITYNNIEEIPKGTDAKAISDYALGFIEEETTINDLSERIINISKDLNIDVVLSKKHTAYGNNKYKKKLVITI